MVFDEVHYIKATRAHLEGIGANAEHTPLVKVFMTIPFTLLGDYWFAWRFPIVVCCMISYLAFYYIAKHFLERRYALLATTFLCFEVMYFIHGTIFLLDMPAIMFGMLGIAFYLRKHHIWSSVSMALAILCKEIALLLLGALLIYVLATKNYPMNFTRPSFRGKHKHKLKFKSIRKLFPLVKGMFIYIGIFVLVGFTFILAYDNIYKISKGERISIVVHNNIITDENGNPITTSVYTSTQTHHDYITNPIEHLKLFTTYHGEWMVDLNLTYRAFQKPWNWITPLDPKAIIDYPVYFNVHVTAGDKSYNTISWKGQGTLPIWYGFWLVIPMTVYQLLTGKERALSWLLLAWVAGSTAFWIGMELIKKSTGFNYYFIYTVPGLCLGIVFFWKNMEISDRLRNFALSVHLLSVLIFFVYFFPVNFIR